MKQFILSLIFLAAIAVTGNSQTCGAITKAGTACSRKVSKAGEHCWQHGGTTKAQSNLTQTASTPSTLCGAPTKAGGTCKKRVKGGGMCHLHKG